MDEVVLGNRALLGNMPIFERQMMPIVMRHFRDHLPEPDAANRDWIRQLLVNEYVGESRRRLRLV